MEDDAERKTLAGGKRADAVADLNPIVAAHALERAMPNRKDDPVAPRKAYDLRLGLLAHTLFSHDELPSRKVLFWT